MSIDIAERLKDWAADVEGEHAEDCREAAATITQLRELVREAMLLVSVHSSKTRDQWLYRARALLGEKP